jgi:type II secretory pathway pseudopilin PulG
LIELVVVVGIIVLLTGLTVSVGTRIVERSEVRATENTMRLLDMAMMEWEAQADRKLTWGIDGQDINGDTQPGAVYDVQGTNNLDDPYDSQATPDVLIISEVLQPVRRIAACKAILAQVAPEYLHEYDGNNSYPQWIDTPEEQSQLNSRFIGALTVLDAWDNPIYATHPGAIVPAGNITFTIDADGTVRTYNEDVYGVAVSRRICFVSAGPDGDFGELYIPGQRGAAADNVYSYPVIDPG